MTKARASEIAHEIVRKLNQAGNGFALDFVAVRRFLPLFDLPKFKQLHVSVVPRTDAGSPFSRSTWRHDIQVDIAIQQKLQDDDEETMETMVYLGEQINTFFEKPENRPNVPERLTGNTLGPTLWDPRLQLENKLFTSVVSLTFVGSR